MTERRECRNCHEPMGRKGKPNPYGICNRHMQCRAAYAMAYRAVKLARAAGSYRCLGCGADLGLPHHNVTVYTCDGCRKLGRKLGKLMRSLKGISK